MQLMVTRRLDVVGVTTSVQGQLTGQLLVPPCTEPEAEVSQLIKDDTVKLLDSCLDQLQN